jgi:hypothetical protein
MKASKLAFIYLSQDNHLRDSIQRVSQQKLIPVLFCSLSLFGETTAYMFIYFTIVFEANQREGDS